MVLTIRVASQEENQISFPAEQTDPLRQIPEVKRIRTQVELGELITAY